jgi:hypothetical protein
MSLYKYYCETCNFKCNFISLWNQHLETSKHNNNGKLIRKTIKEQYNKICPQCNFIAKHKEGLNNHILIRHSSKEKREKEFLYYCKICDFGSFQKNIFVFHNNTKKHLTRIEFQEI